MKRLLSNRDVVKAQFDVVPFEGKWLASFGRPELRGTWTIFGNSGSGKTTFALQLCKYLSQFDRVIYNSLEQGLSRSLQLAWARVKMNESGKSVVFGDMIEMDELKERLRRRKSPQVVIIDSITAIEGFCKSDYNALKAEFPDKLFVFIAHEKNGKAHPAVAEFVRCLSDVKIRVEGYEANVVSRFEDREKGEGGSKFIIWEEGSKAYHLNKV